MNMFVIEKGHYEISSIDRLPVEIINFFQLNLGKHTLLFPQISPIGVLAVFFILWQKPLDTCLVRARNLKTYKDQLNSKHTGSNHKVLQICTTNLPILKIEVIGIVRLIIVMGPGLDPPKPAPSPTFQDPTHYHPGALGHKPSLGPSFQGLTHH